MKKQPKRMMLAQFMKKYGVNVEVNPRTTNQVNSGLEKYYAGIRGLHINTGESLIFGVCGNGDTENEAIANMCEEYSNKTLEIWGYAIGTNEFDILESIEPIILVKDESWRIVNPWV